METFNCIPNTAKNKHRPSLTGNSHNVSRCTRPFALDYAPAFSSKVSTVSVSHGLPWQGRHPSTTASCIDVERRSSRGKLCSIALAVASFVVLLAVLAIAGLALYLGILHTETPSPVLSFNCSVKLLKGDIFIGNLQDKMRKYKKQFETLYQRSILGPAFISCLVDRFGNDTQTVYFKLAFNRKKLSRSISNIEKAIKDILLTDAISRNSVFKNIRFDQRTLTVRQILSSSKEIPYSYATSESATIKTIVDSKPFNKATTSSFPTLKRNESKNEEVATKKSQSLVHGSFKISKTDADITEKKSDIPVEKPKVTATIKKTTLKDTSVTSALYKIAAIEKVTSTPFTTSTVAMKIASSTVTSKTVKPKSTTAKPTLATISSNEAPWIPILPNMSPVMPTFPVLSNKKVFSSTSLPNTQNQLVYSSFTNPGLSINFKEAERLGSTSLRSHPIPVNKIPLTELSVDNGQSTYEVTEALTTPDALTEKNPSAVDGETIQDSPGGNKYDRDVKQHMIRNISSMFHDLVSTLDTSKFNFPSSSEIPNQKTDEDPQIMERTGQVEVVMEDTADLVLHTTKIPLVTLLPAKSNSGIGRPIRKRPYKVGQAEFPLEDRSFSSYPVFSVSSEQQNNQKTNNFKVMGILNFANEGSMEYRKDDIVRQPDTNSKIMMKLGSLRA